MDSIMKDALILQYGNEKDAKGLTWTTIADLLNEELGLAHDESTYRRRYKQLLKRQLEDVEEEEKDEKVVEKTYEKVQDPALTAFQLKKMDLEREKRKLSDARIEYNRLIRQEARKESFLDLVGEVISKSVGPIDMPIHYTTYDGGCDLIVHFTDLHTGIDIDLWNNKFNEEVLKKRAAKFTSEILDIAGFHQAENCYLIVGEILSGLIHPNLRLQNNLDLVEQFKLASEVIVTMLMKLAPHFKNIYMYTTPGNHSRMVAKKEDALDGENFDYLLGFYLKARLQNYETIHICDNPIDKEIAMFNVRGNNIFASHGHKDDPKQVVQNFTMMFKIQPDIIYLGHRHLNSLSTVFDTKVIQSGCVSGGDLYANSIRKTNRPEQTVSVVNEKGLLCLYDIQLD